MNRIIATLTAVLMVSWVALAERETLTVSSVSTGAVPGAADIDTSDFTFNGELAAIKLVTVVTGSPTCTVEIVTADTAQRLYKARVTTSATTWLRVRELACDTNGVLFATDAKLPIDIERISLKGYAKGGDTNHTVAVTAIPIVQ